MRTTLRLVGRLVALAPASQRGLWAERRCVLGFFLPWALLGLTVGCQPPPGGSPTIAVNPRGLGQRLAMTAWSAAEEAEEAEPPASPPAQPEQAGEKEDGAARVLGWGGAPPGPELDQELDQSPAEGPGEVTAEQNTAEDGVLTGRSEGRTVAPR